MFVLLFVACERETIVEQATPVLSQQGTPMVQTLSLEEVDQTFTYLKRNLGIERYLQPAGAISAQARTTMDTLGLTIITDLIKQVTLGDYTSYTMKILKETDTTVFYNLTLEYKDGASDMFATKYIPTDYWLANQKEPYQGSILMRRVNKLEEYTDPEEIFDEDLIGGDPNHDLGAGPGGGGSNVYSADYPAGCLGTVVITSQLVPYQCTCADHWPGDTCNCVANGGSGPGYEQVLNYACIEDGSYEPYNPPDDGGSTGGTPNPDPIDDTPLTATIKPKECTERMEGDLNGDCNLTPYEMCLRGGNSQEVCECVVQGNELVECISNRQCNKINDIFEDYPEFKQKLIELANTVTQDHENASGVYDDDTGFDLSGNAQEPFVDLEQDPSSKYIVIAHTHYETSVTPDEDTYSVFSPNDLQFISQRLRENELKASKFVAFLITGKGTRYALTISNSAKFLDFFRYVEINRKWQNGESSTQEETDYVINTIVPIFNKHFDDLTPPAPIKKENTDNQEVLEAFLQFMDEADMGVTLFSMDETFTNYTELEYDTSEPNNIKETQCN